MASVATPRRAVQWNNDIVTELPDGAVALARTPERRAAGGPVRAGGLGRAVPPRGRRRRSCGPGRPTTARRTWRKGLDVDPSSPRSTPPATSSRRLAAARGAVRRGRGRTTGDAGDAVTGRHQSQRPAAARVRRRRPHASPAWTGSATHAEPLVALLGRTADPDQALAGLLAPGRGRRRPRRAPRRAGRRRGHGHAAAVGARREPGAGRPPGASPRALARPHRPDARVHPSRGVRRAGRAAGRGRRRPARRAPVATLPETRGPRRAARRVPPAAAPAGRPRPRPRRRASTTSPPSCPTWPPAPSTPRWRSPAPGSATTAASRPAGRHRDGQVRRPRAQLRQRRRRDLRAEPAEGARRATPRCGPPPSSPRS